MSSKKIINYFYPKSEYIWRFGIMFVSLRYNCIIKNKGF